MRILRIATEVWFALGAAVLGTAAPRVVIVDLDGVPRDSLESAYLAGRLPNFERLFGELRVGRAFATACWYDRATAVFPTVTIAGQASIFTGAPPARHGLPGNQWFDRETGQMTRYLQSGTVPCVYGLDLFNQGGCAGGLANHHLQSVTLYEIAAAAGKTSTVVYNPIYRGATRLILPSLGAMAARRKGVVADYEKFDSSMIDAAVASLRTDGLPDILTVYFSAADEVGHLLGVGPARDYLGSSLDAQLGRLLDAIQSIDPDWPSHTRFVITADHGRTDAGRVAPVGAAQVEEALTLGGFDTGRFRIAENGGMAHVYIRSRVDGARWSDGPEEAEILAAARALRDSPPLARAVHAITMRTRGPGSGYGEFDGAILSRSQLALLNALDSPRSGDLIILWIPGAYTEEGLGAGAHHGSIFDSDLNIPLVLALGGVPAGRSPVPVSTLDVSKFVLDYLGIPPNGRRMQKDAVPGVPKPAPASPAR